MENPATWTELEKTIHNAHTSYLDARNRGVIGLSLAQHIANCLRAAGLVVDDERTRNNLYTSTGQE